MVHNLGYLPMATIILDKGNVSNRLAWRTFQSPNNPSLPSPIEYILVYSKESLSLQENGETDITREEFIKWSLAKWVFPKTEYTECSFVINNKIHPAPFPIELPRRLIKMFSWKNATVLDPFAGTGTTLVASKRLGRNYIGIEIFPGYCEYAKHRLKTLL
jgi:DNA modification methylase